MLPLKIGPIEVWPPLILAPMSGVTNRTMRALYRPFGLGLTVTEFVSSNALKYGSRRTMEMIDQHGLEKPVSTQLWGDDPATMALAARVVRECGADIVDINFGCPAPKVTKTNGGSACLRDPDRCEAIMRAVVAAVDCPVTMKMRLGWSEDALVYVDVARRAQAAGVQAVTLHARTAKQFYRGEADWEHIARLKRAVDIPVIGNGDLDDPQLAMRRMRESGVDAIMLGRATLGNPWLIAQIRDLMEGRDARPLPPPSDRLAVCHRALPQRWSTNSARRARSRRCASTSRSISRGFRAPQCCANGSCTSIAAAETIAVIEATIDRIACAPVAA